MPGPILGIDLGTTFSLVAIYQNGAPRILPDDRGRPLLPSVVRYLEPIQPDSPPIPRVIVGHDARDHAVEHPATTIASVKRLMGRSVRDVAADLPYLSYDVVEGPHATARVRLPWGQVVSPQEVSAHTLRALRDQAERRLGHPVSKAVVTVPAYFDDAQRQATRDAGRLAGLDIVRIVNEPTAAALAYGLGTRPGSPTRHVAVFDLGGGTFDVSILRITPAEAATSAPPVVKDAGDADSTTDTAFFQVLSTAGDTHLGGDDVDMLLVDLFTREIMQQVRDEAALAPSARGSTQAEGRMRGSTDERPASDLASERADLTSLDPHTRQALRAFAESVKIRLSSHDHARLSIRVSDTLIYDRTITRAQLEALITPWVTRALDSCRRALRDARAQLGEAPLDAVVMVGGSTRIPLVRRLVGEFFDLEPYTALDPDQVVALGAAVQAGILSGDATGSLLLDVVPLSLGIETVGGAVAKIILRNSGVPARATEMFSTSVDGQTSIRLTVYQGEREMAGDCRSLAEFSLSGIPPMPAGIPQLEVEFLVDSSGILRVAAHERRSGKRAAIQVIPNHGLTPDEVSRIERDSLTHARDDMTQHRIVDLVVNARLDLKWITERLTRFGTLLDPPYRRDLESKVTTLRTLTDNAERDWRCVDPNTLHAAKESLDRASIRLQEVSITQSLRSEPSEPRA